MSSWQKYYLVNNKMYHIILKNGEHIETDNKPLADSIVENREYIMFCNNLTK